MLRTKRDAKASNQRVNLQVRAVTVEFHPSAVDESELRPNLRALAVAASTAALAASTVQLERIPPGRNNPPHSHPHCHFH